MARLDEKEQFFRDFAVWPTYEKFDTAGWFKNFNDDELPTAQRLLSSFAFFNKQLTVALFRSSIQNYLAHARVHLSPFDPRDPGLLSGFGFVLCEGEEPHPTDSGHLFARILRDEFDVPEQNILKPNLSVKSRWLRHIVVFDDFCGSGNQFISTLENIHEDPPWRGSILGEAAARNISLGYCTCIMTQYAAERIRIRNPDVFVSAAHMVGPEANVSLPTSRVWKGLSADEATRHIQVIKTASARAGYFASDGSQDDWRGFHSLGLNIAFDHGIPDACLPIFFSSRNGWQPLIKRT